jgi:3-hydroxyacyl-[acyl-carrier-protein] dehydratase
MRWLWIDRFLRFESGKAARAVKNLSLAEDVFAEHFPGFPVMPACLILEGIAQTGGILVGEANDFQEKVILAKIVFARFRREALAGEQLVFDAELLHMRPEGAAVAGKVYALAPGTAMSETRASETRASETRANETLADPLCEAELFFAHLDKARSQQVFGDHNFVFGGELKHLLGLAKLAARS